MVGECVDDYLSTAAPSATVVLTDQLLGKLEAKVLMVIKGICQNYFSRMNAFVMAMSSKKVYIYL